MRHILFSIYNKVALDVNDPQFKKIERQEYLTVAGEIAYEISKLTRLFIVDKEFIVDIDDSNIIIVRSSHALYGRFFERDTRVIATVDLVNDAEQTVTQTTDYTDEPYDDYIINYNLRCMIPLTQMAHLGGISDEMFKPIYVLKTIRNNIDCHEYSWQAIESQYRGDNVMKINDTELSSNCYAIRRMPGDSHFYNQKNLQTGNNVNPDSVLKLSESLMFFFATPLIKGEVIRSTFTVQMPIHSELNTAWQSTAVSKQEPTDPPLPQGQIRPNNINTGFEVLPKFPQFEDHTIIPDFMETALYKGIRKAIIEKLVMREGDGWMNRFNVAKMEYQKELNDLAAYIRNLKDLQTTNKVQPLKWLSDHGESIPRRYFDPNIPEEWHTNNILT